PSTLSLGQTAMFNSAGQFTVESQDTDHPFYMAGYMTGCEMYNPSGSDCRGDPEFVNVIPPDQFLKAYTFFTDPTYPETDLVLTRERDGGQFADVTIDCVGTVSGWQPIDAADQIEYTRVDLVTGNFQGVGNCNNGLHVASSSNKFGLVVWGWGSAATGVFSTQAVSYAYPAGASLKHINHVVIE
ncbi:MAG: IgGFc-binding protein, partial [Deltaproteobacteria bacterium]